MKSADLHLSEWLHRRHPTDLGKQTLACHVAFWKPLPSPERRLERFKAIDQLLKSIHDKYEVPFRHGLNETHPLVVVKTSWHSFPVTLRFFLHPEFISIAIFIHIDILSCNERNDIILSTVYEHISNITNMTFGGTCDYLPMHNKFIYETLWNLFFRENELVPSPSPSWPFPPELENPVILANFRGLIIGTEASTNNSGASWVDFSNDGIVNRLKPFLCCKSNINIDDFSICTMKGGLAFHASTLGRLRESGEKDAHRYVVCAKSLDKSQLGELIDTGHWIGTLRLAAIMLGPRLGEAKRHLRQIEYEIGATYRRLNDPDGLTRELQDRIGEILSRSIQRLNDAFDGDLRERLRHSRGYKKQCDSLMSSLQISRIEGYKPFDQTTSDMLLPTSLSVEQLLKDYDRVMDEYRILRYIASVESTAKKNTVIEELQVTAELFLFVALVPYYLGNWISETTHAFFDGIFGIDDHKHSVVDKLIWLFALTLGGYLALGSLAKHKSHTKTGEIVSAIIETLHRTPPESIKLSFRRLLLSATVWVLGVFLFAVLLVIVEIQYRLIDRIFS